MAPTCVGRTAARSTRSLRHIKEYVCREWLVGRGHRLRSLKVYSRDLAELAALAVLEDWHGQASVVRARGADARGAGARLAEVLALPQTAFLLEVLLRGPPSREHFPLKVWADCNRCARQPADEVSGGSQAVEQTYETHLFTQTVHRCSSVGVCPFALPPSPLTPSCSLERFPLMARGIFWDLDTQHDFIPPTATCNCRSERSSQPAAPDGLPHATVLRIVARGNIM